MSLKVFQSYGRAADADVLTFGLSVASKMTDNPHFVNPPIDLAGLDSMLNGHYRHATLRLLGWIGGMSPTARKL